VYKVQRVDDNNFYAMKKVNHASDSGQNQSNERKIKVECSQ